MGETRKAFKNVILKTQEYKHNCSRIKRHRNENWTYCVGL